MHVAAAPILGRWTKTQIMVDTGTAVEAGRVAQRQTTQLEEHHLSDILRCNLYEFVPPFAIDPDVPHAIDTRDVLLGPRPAVKRIAIRAEGYACRPSAKETRKLLKKLRRLAK